MRHPKSHHVSEIEPKQKRRIKIRYKPACQHGTSKKNVNGLISKAMQVSWLYPERLSASEQCCSRGYLKVFFFDPQRRVKIELKFHDIT